MPRLAAAVATLLAWMVGIAAAAVEVNRAGRGELTAVKGIGPALSARIVDARGSGAFRDWADLQGRVRGIGPGAAVKLSAAGLTVNGDAYAGIERPRPTTPRMPRRVIPPRPLPETAGPSAAPAARTHPPAGHGRARRPGARAATGAEPRTARAGEPGRQPVEAKRFHRHRTPAGQRRTPPRRAEPPTTDGDPGATAAPARGPVR